MMPRVGTARMEGMKNLDGFPIQTEIMGITSTVSRIEKKTSSSGEFEVPANFKKVKPEGLERMKKMNH
jgi:hypothetical protein